MASDRTLEQLTHFVATELLDGDGSALTETTPLLEWGVLDSVSILSLLAFIEHDLGVSVPDERVRPEHFQNLARLCALVDSLSGPVRPLGSQRVTMSTPARVVSRAANEAHRVRLVEVARGSGEMASVMHAPGPDPAWLLVPGPLQPSSSWGATLRTQVDRAATWAPNLLSLGPDDPGTDVITLGPQIEALLDLEAALSPSPMVLVGHDLGAAIAAEIARRRPERVVALVVVGFGHLKHPAAWWQEVITLSDQPTDYLRRTHHHPPELTPLLQARMEAVLQSPAYRGFLTPDEVQGLSTVFDGLTVPTLFVGGESDDLMPASALEAGAARVPGARVEWLARCGHLAPLERSQEMLSAIHNFLSTTVLESH